MKWLGIMLMAALLAVAPGYGRAQPPEGKGTSPAAQPQSLEEEGTPAPATKSYSLQERRAYQQKVAADLAELQRKIGDLQGKYQMARPQMKRTFLRFWGPLKKQLFAVQNQLASLENSSEKNWSGRKDDMDIAMQQLRQTYEDAEMRLQ